VKGSEMLSSRAKVRSEYSDLSSELVAG
jgi:hypothetical protein